MARPSWQPKQEKRTLVKSLAAMGLPQKQICATPGGVCEGFATTHVGSGKLKTDRLVSTYEGYEAGDRVTYLERGGRALAEIVSKSYRDDLIFFKVRILSIQKEFIASMDIKVGDEFEVSRLVDFEGWVQGMWRFTSADTTSIQ